MFPYFDKYKKILDHHNSLTWTLVYTAVRVQPALTWSASAYGLYCIMRLFRPRFAGLVSGVYGVAAVADSVISDVASKL
jgi:hypothetical protein